MDFSNMQFYKHMGGFFMHSISLPEKLTKQLAHLTGRVLELKRPSGTWYVGLIMSGDKLVLQPGWNDFARANNISQNDHLVFKFIGGSKFEVFIFDPTGCEMVSNVEKEEQEQNGSLGSIVGEELSKELHYSDVVEKYEWVEIEGVIETSHQNKENLSFKGEHGAETSNDYVPIEELLKNLNPKEELHKIQCENKIQRSNQMATECPSEKLGEKEEVNKETSSDSVPIGKLLQIHSEKPKHRSDIQCETKNPPMKRLLQNPCSLPSKKWQKRRSSQSCYNNYTSKSRVQLTAGQKNRAKQLVCKVQASNPYFQVFLKKHNVTPSYRLYFPAKFSAAHLQKENLEVILCCPDQGKTWFVRSNFNIAKNEQILMGSTFQKFLKENKLHIGDLCVFELLKTAKRLTFAVHFSRATNILES